MATTAERFRQLLAEVGGDPGEAYNRASAARGTGADPEAVALERYSQAYDRPELGLAALPYEALKSVEMGTGVPALSKTIDVFGLPQGWKPGRGTSMPSMTNVTNAWQGAGRRFLDELLGR